MKITNTKQLSAYLRDIRLDEQLSQTDVARKVGIRQDTVSSFELRPDATKMETFFKLLSALELEIEIIPRNAESTDNTAAWKEEW
jgi:HTH-type transcriptional regulator/antitoxin HipB